MLQKVRSVAGGVIFLVLCAGGALAMPASFTLEPREEAPASADVVADLDADVTAIEGETTDVTVPEEDDGQDDEDQGEDPDGSTKPDNHGKAVSTAAHCDLRGRAKGQLVRAVARDKTATADSAQAACEAAKAAAPAAKPAKPARPAKPAKAAKPPKPANVPAPAKRDKAAKSVAAPEVEEGPAASAPAAPPAPGGPPPGKGNSKKS